MKVVRNMHNNPKPDNLEKIPSASCAPVSAAGDAVHKLKVWIGYEEKEQNYFDNKICAMAMFFCMF